jgi:hypothetical protein
MFRKFYLPLAILSILAAISCEKKVVEVRYAPVLFDLAAPDSMEKGSPDSSHIAVSAFDPDGLEDIDSVYYVVTRPDSTSNGIRFRMRDDGAGGDSSANDGRYTYVIPSPLPSSQSGDYTFAFYAYDRQDNRSNIISKIITAF